MVLLTRQSLSPYYNLRLSISNLQTFSICSIILAFTSQWCPSFDSSYPGLHRIKTLQVAF